MSESERRENLLHLCEVWREGRISFAEYMSLAMFYLVNAADAGEEVFKKFLGDWIIQVTEIVLEADAAEQKAAELRMLEKVMHSKFLDKLN